MSGEIMAQIRRIDIWIQELHDLYRATDETRLQDAHAMQSSARMLLHLWRQMPDLETSSNEEIAKFSHRVRTQINTIIGFSHHDTLTVYDHEVAPRERMYYNDIHKLGKTILQRVNEYLNSA